MKKVKEPLPQFRPLTEEEQHAIQSTLERHGHAPQTRRVRYLKQATGVRYAAQLESGLPGEREKKNGKEQLPAFTMVALLVETPSGVAVLQGVAKRCPKDPLNPIMGKRLALTRAALAAHDWIDKP